MKTWFQERPAVALFFLAPIFGELFSGSMPLNEYLNPFAVLTLGMLYGCGAILARELVIRWKKGWFSLLLLGFAYGIYEEGLMVRSFFDPNWVDLGALGVYGRVAGVNWVWAEHLTIFHALISIAASVAFVEILYPQRRAEPWVRSRRWFLAIWGAFLLTLPIGKLLTPYDAPDGWVLLTWLTIFALLALARLLPAWKPRSAKRPAPRPRRFFWTGFFGMFGQFFLVYQGADNGAYPFPTAMLLLLAYDLLLLGLLLRWSGRGAAWDDRHRMALILGALSFFLAFTPLTIGTQYPVLYLSNPVFLFLLWRVYRRVAERTDRQTQDRHPQQDPQGQVRPECA